LDFGLTGLALRNAIVERSAILDTSKFVRIAVDWLLRSDIGEVIARCPKAMESQLQMLQSIRGAGLQ
jgi:hypothetical protein